MSTAWMICAAVFGVWCALWYILWAVILIVMGKPDRAWWTTVLIVTTSPVWCAPLFIAREYYRRTRKKAEENPEKTFDKVAGVSLNLDQSK